MKPKSLPSRLFNRNSAAASGEALSVGAARKYQRHVDCAEDSSSTGSEPVADSSRQHREIHFAFLPERYEPLTDDEAKEEKKKRKKEKYKKVKKPQSGLNIQTDACPLGCAVTYSIPLNVGKALRSTWKCMMLGLYNFALGYSTPITVAATFVPDFHRGRT